MDYRIFVLASAGHARRGYSFPFPFAALIGVDSAGDVRAASAADALAAFLLDAPRWAREGVAAGTVRLEAREL